MQGLTPQISAHAEELSHPSVFFESIVLGNGDCCEQPWSAAEASCVRSLSTLEGCVWARAACLPPMPPARSERQLRLPGRAVQEKEDSTCIAR